MSLKEKQYFCRKFCSVDTQRKRLQNFKILFESFYPRMVKIALFYLHDRDSAEDIVQEIFTKVWEKNLDLQIGGYLNGYLQNAVKNNCLSYLKHLETKNKAEQEYQYIVDMASEDTEFYLERISQLIEQLPPKRRQVLELNIVEQKSYQEIAEALDLSVNTVKEHIRKAYAFLRDKTKDEIPKQILYFLLVKRQMANLNT